MIAGSVAAHLAVFAGLALSLRTTWRAAEPAIMNVQLARLARPPSKPPPPTIEHRQTHAARAAALAIPPPPAPLAAPDVTSRSAPAATETGDERVRQALRRALGCRNADLMNLSPAERERCRAQFAGASVVAPSKLDLDRRRFGASKDAEPYLQRRPKNGCKARAGGEASPSGDQGAAAGVGCAWAF